VTSNSSATDDQDNATGIDQVLAVANVRVTFANEAGAPVHALSGISLAIGAGELVALTGRSGSGKSTLLNVAGGLVGITSGTVTLCGHAVEGQTQARLADLRRRYVGYVFQDFNLFPSLTAAENVSLPLELDGVDLPTARCLAVDALSSVQLGDHADRFPSGLSGGERQRVAIARGIVGDKALLLADEPTASLDALTGETIMRLLREQCDNGSAAIVVTHEPATAAWADRVIRLSEGTAVVVSDRGAVIPEITGRGRS